MVIPPPKKRSGARSLTVAAFVVSIALSGAWAQQPDGTPQSPPAAPIVIPPATTGLAAASEELREALDESVLPQSIPELLRVLDKRAGDIQQTIASGAF